MKSILLGAMALIGFSAQAQLVEKPLPISVHEAVISNYELGRHSYDTGGIHSLAQYENPNAQTLYKTILEVITRKGTAAARIAKQACENMKSADCVRAIIEKKSSVQASSQYHDIQEFITEMLTWVDADNNDAEEWQRSLKAIQNHLEKTLGRDYKKFSFGYDDVADVFSVIAISADRKKVLVMSADFGS